MTPQQRKDALTVLLEEIEEDIAPSNKVLERWVKRKDSLNPSPGKHHATRQVSRGQIKGDVERLILGVNVQLGL